MIYTILKFAAIIFIIVMIFLLLKSIREKSKINKLKNEVKKEIEAEVYREAKEVLKVKLKEEMIKKITEEKQKSGFNKEKFQKFFGSDSLFKNSGEKIDRMMNSNKQFGTNFNLNNYSNKQPNYVNAQYKIVGNNRDIDIEEKLKRMMHGKI